MGRKIKKVKSGIRKFLFVIVIVFFVYKSTIIPGNHHIFEGEYDGETSLNSSLKIIPDFSDIIPDPSLKTEADPYVTISPDRLNSRNAILIRLEDQTILMQKDSEEKIYPASLTKLMTAIAAIENLPDLKEEIKLTNATFQGLYEADASMAGFQPGEKVKVIDLLYGALLPSGADSCIGLAEHIAGSEQRFVKLMNQKAADLGMDNTHFENATGFHHNNHYTTVKDLAILLSYALQNDTFREIFTSSRYSIQPTNMHPGGITFYSTMSEKLIDQSVIGGEILGGKTGYTEKAGLCLASLAKVGKQEYVLITTGAKGDHNSVQYNITDALDVYNSIGR